MAVLFGFDVGAEVRAEAAFNDDVDPSREYTLQFLDQGQVVAETAIFRQVDQQVDVAVRSFLATQHRAEQAQIRRAVPRGDREKDIAAAVQIIT
jgi:methylmalonyl-CoA mutase cobalamin-binding subunit